jgi:hypothetical protein
MATRMTTVATAAKSNWIPLNGIAQPLSFADAASIAAEDGSWMSGRRSGAGYAPGPPGPLTTLPAVSPPSMTITEPVKYAASSQAR